MGLAAEAGEPLNLNVRHGMTMKAAIRILAIYFFLMVLLLILASIDSASWCSGTCDLISLSGAYALLLLSYPGLMITEYIFPYNSSGSVWLTGAIANAVILFILINVFIQLKKHE